MTQKLVSGYTAYTTADEYAAASMTDIYIDNPTGSILMSPVQSYLTGC